MKKIILFLTYLLIIANLLLIMSCYNNLNKPISIANITLIDVKCDDCYNEISSIIKKNEGIYDFEIFQSENESIIIINIRYNHKIGNLHTMKLNFISHGFIIKNLDKI